MGSSLDSLAQVLIIASSLALPEQNVKHLVHIQPQEPVRERHGGGKDGESDGFGEGVVGEVLAAEGGDLEVVLDDEGAVETLWRMRSSSAAEGKSWR